MKKTIWKAVRPVITAAVAGCFLVTAAGCTYPWASAAPTEEAPAAVADSSPSDAKPDSTTDQDTAAPADPFATSTEAAQGETVAPDDAFSKNPSVDLPDEIAPSIPEDATFVGPELVATESGKILEAATGETVTDPEVVGTADTPPDPLVRSEGRRFIPETVEDVREKVGDGAEVSEGASGTTDAVARRSGKGSVTSSAYLMSEEVQAGKFPAESVALQNNNYGAYWGTYGGTPAFFERGGNLFAQQAKGVIDVSEHQGRIDWAKVKASGVEGAIIRIGYGQYNWDKQAKRNIAECKRLGIPFGIYLYSYAYDAGFARTEGRDTASMLKNAGVSGKTAYPIYYDLEAWSWTGHAHPTSPGVYDGIVNAWYAEMKAAGFTNLGVYSYTSFLHSALNSANIHSKTTWVAQYGAKMQYTNFPSNFRGWQYWSSGRVNGIAGNVDLNAFGNKTAVATGPNLSALPKMSVPDGKYYISASFKDSSGVDIPSGSKANGAAIQLYKWNLSAAQQFEFRKQSDGSYMIRNVHSGKVLDVAAGIASNGGKVQQYDWNGTAAQRWYLKESKNGTYYIQSAIGNWALDVNGQSSSNSTRITLHTPNGSNAQRFVLSSPTSIPSGGQVRVESAANRSFVFDMPGASKSDAARVQIYRKNYTLAQTFIFNQTGNGIFTITNSNSGKKIEVAGASPSNGAAVQQYSSNGTQAQTWIARDAGNGAVTLLNRAAGKAIDVPNGQAKDSAKLQSYSTNGSAAQKWYLVEQRVLTEREKLTEFAQAHKADVADGTYSFKSIGNRGVVLDIAGGSTTNGANVQIYDANGSGAQLWRVSHDTHGYLTLTNPRSGKVLDINSGLAKNGQNAQLWSSNGSWAQKWIGVKQSNGSVALYSAIKPNFVLDVEAGRMENNTNIRLWTWNGTAAQRWVLNRS